MHRSISLFIAFIGAIGGTSSIGPAESTVDPALIGSWSGTFDGGTVKLKVADNLDHMGYFTSFQGTVEYNMKGAVHKYHVRTSGPSDAFGCELYENIRDDMPVAYCGGGLNAQKRIHFSWGYEPGVTQPIIGSGEVTLSR